MERTINKRLIEEVQRLVTTPLDLEEDLFVEEEEFFYEAVDPETIEELMEFVTAETILGEQEFKTVIQDLLDSVTPRESKVLKLRFGIDMGKEHTLEEIAKIMDLTREGIRQIEARALRKMRHPSKSDRLWVHLNPESSVSVSDRASSRPPKIVEDDWDMYGQEQFEQQFVAWKAEVIRARAKIEEIRKELKKGTLV